MLYALLLLAQPAPDKPAEGPGILSLMPLLLIFVVFIFLIVLPSRRREKQQREALFNALKKDDEVLTAGGIIGIVANIKDKEDEVTLKVDESANVRLRVLKSSIVRILNSKDAGKASDPLATAITKHNP